MSVCKQCGNKDNLKLSFGDRNERLQTEVSHQRASSSNLRSQRGRKDADQEFFQMSLISQIMTHAKQKQLIEM